MTIVKKPLRLETDKVYIGWPVKPLHHEKMSFNIRTSVKRWCHLEDLGV